MVISLSATMPTRWITGGLGMAMGALLFTSGAPSHVSASRSSETGGAAIGAPSVSCVGPDTQSAAQGASAEYYEFELVPTRNVPGTGRSSGLGRVTFTPSPFVVSIGSDGSYQYDLAIETIRLKPPREGVLVAWAMTPEIDRVVRLGTLDENMSVSGSVEWNKFLVAITLETDDDAESKRWAGPVVMRGVSRSGLMHTMAGHGPFQKELCATYGFGN
jgi:hypothetical protein